MEVGGGCLVGVVSLIKWAVWKVKYLEIGPKISAQYDVVVIEKERGISKFRLIGDFIPSNCDLLL